MKRKNLESLKMKASTKKEPKEIIVELLEELGFACVSHPTSIYKQIYVKDELVIHVEDKTREVI